MKSIGFWCICCLFINLVIGAPMTVLAPSEDPFYKGPEGFESEKVGTVLKWRVSPHKLTSMYFPMNVKNSWDILVRSEDPQGNPVAVVSTIVEPYNADPTKLVAYNAAQDSSNFDCSPTYAILQGSPFFQNSEIQLEWAFMGSAAMLSQGYYVITTNYETTTNYSAAFTAGRLAGQNILNSLRGALSSANITGLNDPEIILWGYSGGALASGWTAALVNAYAPELQDSIIGAAVGGLPANITETILAVDGGVFAGLVPNGVLGLVNQYPQLAEVVEKEIIPSKYQEFEEATEFCLLGSIFRYANQVFFVGDTNETYSKHGLEVLNNPLVVDVLLENTLAINKSEVPQMPIFMYHGKLDGVVPYVNSNISYTNWCADGAPSIEFVSDITGGHITDAVISLPGAATWINNRFKGKEPVKGCHRTEYLTMLEYPNATQELKDILHNAFNMFLDEPMGPSNITKRDIEDLHNQGLLSDEFLANQLYKKFKSKFI